MIMCDDDDMRNHAALSTTKNRPDDFLDAKCHYIRQ